MTCDKYSDVLPGNILSIQKFWPDYSSQVIVVTDKEPSKRIDNIEYIIAGDIEFSDRLKFALSQIDCDYILFSLDDYYINKPVDTAKVNEILEYAKKNDIDYIRLNTNSDIQEVYYANKELDLKYIDLSYHRYKVNLFIGLWKKETLLNMCDESLNPWQFEVSLTEKMDRTRTKCLTLNNNNLIKIIDVVIKGRIKRDAWKYVRINQLYNGHRKKQKLSNYLKLKFVFLFKKHTSIKTQTRTKRFLQKLGFRFYSDW